MKIKLIFLLSLFGALIATLSLFSLTQKIEPFLWLIIFVFYAYIIAKNTREMRFLNGFLVSLINGFWIAIIHSVFFSIYIQYNPQMLADYNAMPKFVSFRVITLFTGPIIGAALGLISGLFAFIAGKLLDKRHN